MEVLCDRFICRDIKYVEDSKLLLDESENNGENILEKVLEKYELLYSKILDALNIMVFQPIVKETVYDEKLRKTYSRNKLFFLEKYGKLEEEIYEIPSEYYYKRVGHEKKSIDPNAKVHYRRLLYSSLEDTNMKTSLEDGEDEDFISFKVPITDSEMKILEKMEFEKKLDEEILEIVKSKRLEKAPYEFKSSFNREHILRGKSNMEKKKNFIFDSMRDQMKFIFINDKTNLRSIDFNHVYKNQNSQLDNELEKLLEKKKIF